jgi:prolyl-tRNA synthetase
MKLSNSFSFPRKEVPHDAEIISHQLMIKAGLIEKTASGIYSWLPLGLKVLNKIADVIRREHEEMGVGEILMPILQPASLWKESGRYDAYGKEMLRVKDRHDRDMLFGPTNEEVVTDIFRKHVKSYKVLPVNLFQIQWKFRDEIRPRFGVMRGREFLMKDAYSFDLDEEKARETYKKYYALYLNIFRKLGITAIAVRADNGAIGGDLSHEFHILADTGESEVFAEEELFKEIEGGNYDFDKLKDYYAAADEMHDEEKAKGKKIISRRGIEVGHIFNFGCKYSSKLKALVAGQDGKPKAVNMGSYGIGVSRVMAAIIESSHDENGIIWPEEIAPYKIVVNPMKVKNEELMAKAMEIYESLKKDGKSVVIDDRDMSPGEKFASHDLIGFPTQIILGERSFKEGEVELKNRATGERKNVKFNEIYKVL